MWRFFDYKRLLTTAAFLTTQCLICGHSLKCYFGTLTELTSIETKDNQCLVYIETNHSCPDTPVKFGSMYAVGNLSGKCGVWQKKNSSRHHFDMVSSCFCSTDGCNTKIFAQDRISAVLADKSGTLLVQTNLKGLTVEHSDVRMKLLRCLKETIERSPVQNNSSDGKVPLTIPRNISLPNWILVIIVGLLLLTCVASVCIIVGRRGKKLQDDLKSSRPSVVELEFSEKDGACNEKTLIEKLRNLEQKSSESGKEQGEDNEGKYHKP
ncbi:hypothetical protein RB195_015140 [Necator americanus]|uniref:Activin types I and II receptor domain protein n=1 Tax=Necator americanus TaxID=51031 RepID=A0ABR1E364_NECAM